MVYLYLSLISLSPPLHRHLNHKRQQQDMDQEDLVQGDERLRISIPLIDLPHSRDKSHLIVDPLRHHVRAATRPKEREDGG